MNAAEIILQCHRDGLTLREVDGKIGIRPKSKLAPDLAEQITANRDEVLLELWRNRIWRELKARPGKDKYFEIYDSDSDCVRVVLAIRDVGTCDLLIARDKWDPVRFLELLDSEGEPVH